MGNQSKYYVLYRFDDGSSYKVEVGKDGVTVDDMRNLRNTIKVEYRANAKEALLDAVSIEASFIDEDKHSDLIDKTADTMLIVETTDEYDTLHRAIEQLQPQQQELLQKVYFDGIPAAVVAKQLGITKQAANDRLSKIYARLRKLI